MGKVELKIEIDADLLSRAAAAGVDLPAITESAVRAALADEEKAKRWAHENAEAILAHRERIEKYGVFGDDLRSW
jgi:antitoxin CcdA